MKIGSKICKFLMLMTLACSQIAFCETTEDSKPSKIAKVSRQRKRKQKDDESIASKALKIGGGIIVFLAAHTLFLKAKIGLVPALQLKVVLRRYMNQ